MTKPLEFDPEDARAEIMEAIDATMDGLTPPQRLAVYRTLLETLEVEQAAEQIILEEQMLFVAAQAVR